MQNSSFVSKLLILGAGQYGMLVRETAEVTGRFEKIGFLDDHSPKAIGKLNEYRKFLSDYPSVFVAMGNGRLRGEWIATLAGVGFTVESFVHPRAYVAPSARLGIGCIVEPMAVVHAYSVLADGVLVSAGAVVNHNAEVGECAHIDCNAVIPSNSVVPGHTKVEYGTVFRSSQSIQMK